MTTGAAVPGTRGDGAARRRKMWWRLLHNVWCARGGAEAIQEGLVVVAFLPAVVGAASRMKGSMHYVSLSA